MKEDRWDVAEVYALLSTINSLFLRVVFCLSRLFSEVIFNLLSIRFLWSVNFSHQFQWWGEHGWPAAAVQNIWTVKLCWKHLETSGNKRNVCWLHHPQTEWRRNRHHHCNSFYLIINLSLERLNLPPVWASQGTYSVLFQVLEPRVGSPRTGRASRFSSGLLVWLGVLLLTVCSDKWKVFSCLLAACCCRQCDHRPRPLHTHTHTHTHTGSC